MSVTHGEGGKSMAFKTLSIRIPEEAHQKLEKLAEERQQKVSDVAR